MRLHLMDQDQYDDHVLSSPDEPIFDEQDNYFFWHEFDIFLSRDQIRLQIEEYQSGLKANSK